MTPFKANSSYHLGRRNQRPHGRSLAGRHQPGTVMNDIYASYDWLPTLVEIAGGPKGNDLRAQIEKENTPASPKPISMA